MKMKKNQKINSGIYVIKNIVNGKYYVGSSVNINHRINCHKSDLSLNKHHSIKLQSSVNKHGINSFLFEIIQYCSIKTLIINEQYWINHFNSYNKGYDCNPIAENCLGRIPS